MSSESKVIAQLLERVEKMETEVKELRSQLEEKNETEKNDKWRILFDIAEMINDQPYFWAEYGDPDWEEYWEWKCASEEEKDEIVRKMSFEEANEEKIYRYFILSMLRIVENGRYMIEDY